MPAGECDGPNLGDTEHTDSRHTRRIFAVKVGQCIGLSRHVQPREKG